MAFSLFPQGFRLHYFKQNGGLSNTCEHSNRFCLFEEKNTKIHAEPVLEHTKNDNIKLATSQRAIVAGPQHEFAVTT